MLAAARAAVDFAYCLCVVVHLLSSSTCTKVDADQNLHFKPGVAYRSDRSLQDVGQDEEGALYDAYS